MAWSIEAFERFTLVVCAANVAMALMLLHADLGTAGDLLVLVNASCAGWLYRGVVVLRELHSIREKAEADQARHEDLVTMLVEAHLALERAGQRLPLDRTEGILHNGVPDP